MKEKYEKGDVTCYEGDVDENHFWLVIGEKNGEVTGLLVDLMEINTNYFLTFYEEGADNYNRDKKSRLREEIPSYNVLTYSEDKE